MAGTTSPNAIPYMTATDPLAGLDEYTLSLATRLQAMFDMAQGGTVVMSGLSAGVSKTQRVNFPTSFTSANPNVVVGLGETAAAGAVSCWAESVDNTGFTIGVNATGTSNRTLRWIANP